MSLQLWEPLLGGRGGGGGGWLLRGSWTIIRAKSGLGLGPSLCPSLEHTFLSTVGHLMNTRPGHGVGGGAGSKMKCSHWPPVLTAREGKFELLEDYTGI